MPIVKDLSGEFFVKARSLASRAFSGLTPDAQKLIAERQAPTAIAQVEWNFEVTHRDDRAS
jgi:hypothetical protein